MENKLMTTKEVAEYLGIHEKQVYALIKENKIPCTRLTGKWIFPKHLIDEWINIDARNSAELPEEIYREKRPEKNYILAAGSNDPILDILLNDLHRIDTDTNIFSCSTGSTDGLKLLEDGLVDISFCHIFDPDTEEYNIPFIKSYFKDKKVALIHLFYREIGFVTHPKHEKAVISFREIKERNLKIINRQPGSGTRVLLDYSLENIGVKPLSLKGYENEVSTHFEVCMAILSGEADTGIATITAAKLFNLPFKPIRKESFDMVMSYPTFFDKTVQTFIKTLKSDEFKKRISHLGEYDFTDSGNVIYSVT
ncbi:MAG: helix-turn-helix domain-containing protein [Leptospirales bacterium]|nr:helix-turn-helix domain-containing protein [Leptospirales bacterium]